MQKKWKNHEENFFEAMGMLLTCNFRNDLTNSLANKYIEYLKNYIICFIDRMKEGGIEKRMNSFSIILCMNS